MFVHIYILRVSKRERERNPYEDFYYTKKRSLSWYYFVAYIKKQINKQIFTYNNNKSECKCESETLTKAAFN